MLGKYGVKLQSTLLFCYKCVEYFILKSVYMQALAFLKHMCHYIMLQFSSVNRLNINDLSTNPENQI